MASNNPPRKDVYLFGYPISHSFSPAFHNNIFAELGLPNRYELHDTEDIENSDMLEIIRGPTFCGAAVTMPLKVTVTKYLDRLEPEAKEIGSVNTIIVEKDANGKTVLVGQNTDWEGVANALVLNLPVELQSRPKPFPAGSCGFIIGGGGTTRAAVYALSRLGLSPIYLINRDPTETKEMIAAFLQYDLTALDGVEQWTQQMEDTVAAGVGAIPSFEPVTDGEKMVYAVSEKVFASRNTGGRSRLFLEMCYKPRKTIMYNIAASYNWNVIEGIEAMIEQGLSQSRKWLLTSAASPFDGKKKELGEAVEASSRALVRGMEDIKVTTAPKL